MKPNKEEPPSEDEGSSAGAPQLDADLPRKAETCYACGHPVYVETDEDGNYRVYRPIEAGT